MPKTAQLILFTLIVVVGLLFGGRIDPTREYISQAQFTDTFDIQDKIFTQRRYGEEITDLTQLFRDQMQSYRTAEDEFNIAYGHHQQVQTLASLEDLVKSSKKLYTIRTQGLITFSELLHAVLLETDGIELTLKDHAIDLVEANLDNLENHLNSLENADDKVAIENAADAFIPLYEESDTAASFAILQISLGNIQEVFDKAILLQKDIQERAETTSLSALQRSEFKRANEEIDRSAKLLRDDIQEMIVSISEDIEKFEAQDSNGYQKNLSSMYSQTSRIVGFVDEVHQTVVQQ